MLPVLLQVKRLHVRLYCQEPVYVSHRTDSYWMYTSTNWPFDWTQASPFMYYVDHYEITMEIKTKATNGIIFFSTEITGTGDYIAGFMVQGIVFHEFSVDRDVTNRGHAITTPITVNDNQWHVVKFVKIGGKASVCVDGVLCYHSLLTAVGKDTYLSPEVYVGGAELKDRLESILVSTYIHLLKYFV